MKNITESVNSMSKNIKRYSFILWMICAVLLLTSCQGFPENNQVDHGANLNNAGVEVSFSDDNFSYEDVIEWGQNALAVSFLDVGQGDAILVTCEGEHMLIDGGDNDHGQVVVTYLENLGVEKLNLVVMTHPDADHIGGIDDCINAFDCDTVLMSSLTAQTSAFNHVVKALKKKNLNALEPKPGDSFSLGSATIRILAPDILSETSNNNSIVVRVEYKENAFLFMGDAETEEQQHMMAGENCLRANVLKLSHHGSADGFVKEFYDAVGFEAAVVSCSIDNEYGHPHGEVIDELKRRGADLYRTDEQGTLFALSDGKDILWNVDPSHTWAYGVNSIMNVKKGDKNAPDIPEEGVFLVNKNSGKIHLEGGCDTPPKTQNAIVCENVEGAIRKSEELAPDTSYGKRFCGDCFYHNG